jgi:putative membrane protein insertion efficiency factor
MSLNQPDLQNTCSPNCDGLTEDSSPAWALRAVRWYQRAFVGRLSPCRFFPSCSEYSVEALQVHGTSRGLWLTARRLVRCRPFGPSGIDLVPPPRRPDADPSHKKAS